MIASLPSLPLRAATLSAPTATPAAEPPARTEPSTEPPRATASGFAGGDFETFLRMLTTQIRNQDPLNPMEGSDFAVQLATFSGVEQQVRTNQLLGQMAGGTGLAGIADWIGREVKTTAPVAYDGAPLTLDIQPAAGADQVRLIVTNESGQEVLREEIGAGSGEIDWLGQGAAGALPPGRYRFGIESLRGGAALGTAPVGVFARVTGAETTPEGVRLTLPGGASVPASGVTALREPRS